MLEYGQRLRDRGRARLGSARGLGAPLWSWLAEGGALAAGAGSLIGRIAPGYRADLVVLDEDAPALRGHGPDTAVDAWLVGGDDRDIEAIYVGGRRRIERGHAHEEDEIGRRFARTMRSLGG